MSRISQQTADVNAAIDAELQLLDPAVRTSRALAARLLDPKFAVAQAGRGDRLADVLPPGHARPGRRRVT
ncbi:hypothetical protein [Streptomyces parvus]|uniref:hypothetical protein n=1 Tax=Streptomyces parvus TaxID=66428 RepID=UPI003450A391